MGQQYSSLSEANSLYEMPLSQYGLKERINSSLAIWKHKSYPYEQLIQCKMIAGQEQELKQLYSIFKFRNKHIYIPSTHYVKIADSSVSSATSRSLHLYVEHPITTLSQLSDIPFPDALHLYQAAFKGFQILVKRFGYFDVFEDMFYICEGGKLKVWCNVNVWGMGIEEYGKDCGGFGEPEMVEKVIGVIDDSVEKQDESNTNHNGSAVVNSGHYQSKNAQKQWSPNIKNLLYQKANTKKFKSFEHANITLRHLCKQYSWQPPQRLKCLAHLSRDDVERLLATRSQVGGSKLGLTSFGMGKNNTININTLGQNNQANMQTTITKPITNNKLSVVSKQAPLPDASPSQLAVHLHQQIPLSTQKSFQLPQPIPIAKQRAHTPTKSPSFPINYNQNNLFFQPINDNANKRRITSPNMNGRLVNSPAHRLCVLLNNPHPMGTLIKQQYSQQYYQSQQHPVSAVLTKIHSPKHQNMSIFQTIRNPTPPKTASPIQYLPQRQLNHSPNLQIITNHQAPKANPSQNIRNNPNFNPVHNARHTLIQAPGNYINNGNTTTYRQGRQLSPVSNRSNSNNKSLSNNKSVNNPSNLGINKSFDRGCVKIPLSSSPAHTNSNPNSNNLRYQHSNTNVNYKSSIINQSHNIVTHPKVITQRFQTGSPKNNTYPCMTRNNYNQINKNYINDSSGNYHINTNTSTNDNTNTKYNNVINNTKEEQNKKIRGNNIINFNDINSTKTPEKNQQTTKNSTHQHISQSIAITTHLAPSQFPIPTPNQIVLQKYPKPTPPQPPYDPSPNNPPQLVPQASTTSNPHSLQQYQGIDSNASIDKYSSVGLSADRALKQKTCENDYAYTCSTIPRPSRNFYKYLNPDLTAPDQELKGHPNQKINRTFTFDALHNKQSQNKQAKNIDRQMNISIKKINQVNTSVSPSHCPPVTIVPSTPKQKPKLLKYNNQHEYTDPKLLQLISPKNSVINSYISNISTNNDNIMQGNATGDVRGEFGYLSEEIRIDMRRLTQHSHIQQGQTVYNHYQHQHQHTLDLEYFNNSIPQIKQSSNQYLQQNASQQTQTLFYSFSNKFVSTKNQHQKPPTPTNNNNNGVIINSSNSLGYQEQKLQDIRKNQQSKNFYQQDPKYSQRLESILMGSSRNNQDLRTERFGEEVELLQLANQHENKAGDIGYYENIREDQLSQKYSIQLDKQLQSENPTQIFTPPPPSPYLYNVLLSPKIKKYEKKIDQELWGDLVQLKKNKNIG